MDKLPATKCNLNFSCSFSPLSPFSKVHSSRIRAPLGYRSHGSCKLIIILYCSYFNLQLRRKTKFSWRQNFFSLCYTFKFFFFFLRGFYVIYIVLSKFSFGILYFCSFCLWGISGPFLSFMKRLDINNYWFDFFLYTSFILVKSFS